MSENGEKKPVSEVKERWYQTSLGSGILVAIIAIAGTVPATLLVNDYSNRLRSLGYYVTTSAGLFRKPDLGGKTLSVTIDGQPVDNVSTATVSILNRSGVDFENVPIELTFSTPSGGTPRLVQSKAFSAPSTAQVLPDTPQTYPATSPATGPLRLNYLLKVVNRSDTETAFVGEYVFEGAEAPQITVAVNQKGIVAQPVAIAEKPTTLLATAVNLTLLGAFLVATIFAFVAGVRGSKRAKQEAEVLG